MESSADLSADVLYERREEMEGLTCAVLLISLRVKADEVDIDPAQFDMEEEGVEASGTLTLEMEGEERLWFAIDEGRPVRSEAELQGSMHISLAMSNADAGMELDFDFTMEITGLRGDLELRGPVDSGRAARDAGAMERQARSAGTPRARSAPELPSAGRSPVEASCSRSTRRVPEPDHEAWAPFVPPLGTFGAFGQASLAFTLPAGLSPRTDRELVQDLAMTMDGGYTWTWSYEDGRPRVARRRRLREGSA